MTPMAEPRFITPDWPAPANVRACVTTRAGGVSRPPYASLNLAAHVGDNPQAVSFVRRLRESLTKKGFEVKAVLE